MPPFATMATAANPSLGTALAHAITTAGLTINAFARLYEGEGASDRRVANRARAVRRWLSGENVPSRLSVRRCEEVLGLDAGALERFRPSPKSDAERIDELYEMVDELRGWILDQRR